MNQPAISPYLSPLEFNEGSLIGVLDIDSPVKNRFDQTDKTYLEQIAELVCSRSRIAPKK